MRCIHCANEIGDDHRFCSFCGGENIPLATVQQNMPPLQVSPQPLPANTAVQPRQVLPAPVKKGGTLKWVLAGAWLALAVIGWIVALVVMFGGNREKTAPEQEAYRVDAAVSLTDGQWYQFDPETGKLYCWRFDGNGTAHYAEAGQENWYQVDYTLAEDTNAVSIHHGGMSIVWEYDPGENCFWLYKAIGTQNYKTRIFPASGIPGGSAGDYTYRVDNGMAYSEEEFETVSQLDAASAKALLDHYSVYIHFGICATGVTESQQEADEAMSAVGPEENRQIYSVGKVPCCRSLEQMDRHLHHMFGEQLLADWGGEVLPAEWNGNVYYFVPAMGFAGFYMTGDLTAQPDGTYTAVLGVDFDETSTYLATFAKEDGTWKLVSLQLQAADESIPELTADAAWQLLERTDVGWLLHYFYGTGLVDEGDVYTYSPMPDSGDFTVDCPSVTGVDSAAQLKNLLRQHYTQRYIDAHFMQVSYHCDRRNADIYGGSWFEANGTVYFEPNWGAGDPMLLRETLRIQKTDVAAWTVTVEREFYTEPETFRIVWENGAFKLDA